MLQNSDKLSIFMPGHLQSDYGKMGFGVLRYAQNEVVAVIDPEHVGKSLQAVTGIPHEAPIVKNIDDSVRRGANVLVIGISPSGGRIPEEWLVTIEDAISKGMSIVNGLHDLLHPRFDHLLKGNQWIWEVRVPQTVPPVASAQAMKLDNIRLLFIGTDMAAGKMTAGLELYHWLRKKKRSVGFVATGQIGITVTGQGIPLDAFKVDLACGAVEEAVLDQQEHDIILVEGQGSLLHPGSTATLPLMRGSCPTHMILCHRAEKTHLKYPEYIKIPSLEKFISLNEELATVVGTYPNAKVIGIALNTSALTDNQAKEFIAKTQSQTGIPTFDLVRYGTNHLGELIERLIV